MSTSPHLWGDSSAPYLHASTSTHLQPASKAPILNISIPLYLHACSESPVLSTSVFPCLHARSPPLDLRTSIPPYRYIYGTLQHSPYLHASTFAYLQRASRVTYAHTSTFPRLHACSAPPDLRALTLLHLHRASRRFKSIPSRAERLGFRDETKVHAFLSGLGIVLVSCHLYVARPFWPDPHSAKQPMNPLILPT